MDQLTHKIGCFFDNLAINYFTFYALHSTDEFTNKQQILGLNQPSAKSQISIFNLRSVDKVHCCVMSEAEFMVFNQGPS